MLARARLGSLLVQTGAPRRRGHARGDPASACRSPGSSTRTDLPGRRVWAVLAALPLVVPSYVAALALLAAFGPRGLLQRALEGPFGVERVPEVYGFPGAWARSSLSTYPYVYLLAAAALRSADPSLEEAARGLGRRPLAGLPRGDAPPRRAVRRARAGCSSPLHPLGLRGRVAHALRLADAGDLPPVPVALRPDARGRARARARRAHGDRARRSRPALAAARPHRRGPAPPGRSRPVAARPLAAGGARLRRRSSSASPSSSRSPSSATGSPAASRSGSPLDGGLAARAQLARRVRARGGRRRSSPRFPSRSSRSAIRRPRTRGARGARATPRTRCPGS